MNIKDRRIKHEINRIIKENLVKGYVPTSNEVIAELGTYMSLNNLTLPSYQYKKIYSNFSLEDINEAKKDVSSDLNIVFESIADLYKEVENQINKFESEKKKYNYRINQLQSELLNLVNKYSTNAYTDTFMERFNDMSNINIANTTCNIDINNNEVTLGKLSDVVYSDIYDITVDTSKIGENGKVTFMNGNPLSYTNTKGSYWKIEVSKPSQEPTTVALVIDLGKIVPINKIEVESPLIKSTTVLIEASADGDKWSKMSEGVIETKITSNLHNNIRFIRLSFNKVEADKFGDGMFKYIYILDTIKLYQVAYAKSSVLLSNPIKLESNINKVSIIDDSIIPSSTNIEYFVAINSPNPEWIPITPVNRPELQQDNKVITFNTINSVVGKQIFLDSSVSKEEYEKKNLSVNTQKIYTLTPNSIGQGQIVRSKLFKGANSWRVDKLTTYIEGNPSKDIFLRNAKDIQTSYKSLTPLRTSQILNGETFNQASVVKYSITLECPDTEQVVNAKLVSNCPTTIYLNGGTPIYEGSPSDNETKNATVKYKFTRGTNVLEIIQNVDKANSENIVPAYLDLGLSLEVLSLYIYADPIPMKEVSLFNLRYNTNNQKDVYAIEKSNNGYEVLIKDDDLSIKYMISYDYVIEDVKEILLSAILKRNYESVNITPKLKGYEIRII